jgi:nitroreductase
MASALVEKNIDYLTNKISNWVQETYPHRTTEFDKCNRDLSYIICAIASCLKQNNTTAIDHVSRIFFKNGVIQLKSTSVELEAYDVLLQELKEILIAVEKDAYEFCEFVILKLKDNLTNGFVNPLKTKNGFNFGNENRDTRIKKMFYDWDQEMEVVRQMQKCQRNWDHSKTVHPEVIDYLLWHAENSPSKQHEGYYDVYWTADRKTLDELYEYTWGTTHSRNPPSTWRNSQMNASLYILFVAKEPGTQLNCHADGSAKSNKDPARWENAYVSIGIAMGLVMRAANALGYSTGCNKSHGDMNGDDFWEKKLGILDQVKAGTMKIAYGIGIGFPQEGRSRWETDQTELCIGAGNGSNLTTLDENDPNWKDRHPRTGREFRKVKIVNIHSTNKEVDPYGNVHQIPDEATIKINTMRKRDIKITEIK